MRTKPNLKLARQKAVEHVVTPMTFKELVDAYSARVFDGADLRMKKWVEAFGDDDAWSITTEDLRPCVEHMQGTYKPSSINRDVSQIGTIYRWGKKFAPKSFVSPTIGLEKLPEQPRVVELSQGELKRLLDGARAFRDQRFGVYVRLLAETGCRKGELLSSKWKHVDLENGRIVVLETKTDRPRTLFFSPETAALMRRIWPKRDDEAMLFEGRIKGQEIDYRRQWLQLTADIGRPDFHQHDLRHVAAANLLKAGKTIAVAAQVLGHGVEVLQRRYGHLETAHLQEAMEAAWTTWKEVA